MATSNAAALFAADQAIIRLQAENEALRRYKTRARKAYRSLQAAHERVSSAYYELHRAHLDLRQERYQGR